MDPCTKVTKEKEELRIVKFILDIKIAKERQTKRVREVVRWRYKHYFSIGLVHEIYI